MPCWHAGAAVGEVCRDGRAGGMLGVGGAEVGSGLQVRRGAGGQLDDDVVTELL